MLHHPDGRPICERIIGLGASGVVIERDGTAVKLPKAYEDSSLPENLTHEKKVYERIGSHAGIVPVLDMTGPGIQMMLMENGSMRDYLEQHPRPTLSVQLYWFYQMAVALVHVHARRVIVADVSARNFLLSSDLTVKFADFGESSILPLEVDMETADDNGYSIFTDLGQFGAAMYEIITGQKCKYDLFEDQPPGPATASLPSRKNLPSTQEIWLGDIVDSCWTQASLQNTEDLLSRLESAILSHSARLRSAQQQVGHNKHVLDYSQKTLNTEDFLSLVGRSLQLKLALRTFSISKKFAIIEGAADAVKHAYARDVVPVDVAVFQFLLSENTFVKLYDLFPTQTMRSHSNTTTKGREKEVVACFGSFIYHVITGEDAPERTVSNVNKTALEGEEQRKVPFTAQGQESARGATDETSLSGIVEACWATDGFQDMASVCRALSSIKQTQPKSFRDLLILHWPHSSSFVGAMLTFTCASAAFWFFWKRKRF